MSQFRSFLVAQARAEGHAVRSAAIRHRALRPDAHLLLLWQLGGEPFSVAAIRWLPFQAPESRRTFITGDPRSRKEFLASLSEFAKAFNTWFLREPSQLIVPNQPTVALLERLSQRLRALPEGAATAEVREPLLVLGRILHFITTEAHRPGQGLLVVLTDLVGSHWATELSDIEASNLACLDAAIEPGRDSIANAVLASEQIALGPSPSRTEDEPVIQLLAELARHRREGNSAGIDICMRGLQEHYVRLFEPVESLCIRCFRRERSFKAAMHVGERWKSDEVPLWADDGPARKTSSSKYYDGAAPDLIARRVAQWERAEQRVAAAEMTEDWMRRAQQVLEGRAITGRVVSCSTQRPLVLKIETDTLPYLPEGESRFVCSRMSPLELTVLSTNGKTLSFTASRYATLAMSELFRQNYPVGATIVLTEFNGRPRDFGRGAQRDLPWTHSNLPIPVGQAPEPLPIDRMDDPEVDPTDDSVTDATTSDTGEDAK